MSNLGESLKMLRGPRSQKAFAKILGMRQQTYANYEIGTREPDLDTLCRIALVCGKTVDELLGVAKMSPPDRSANKVEDLKKAIVALLHEY